MFCKKATVELFKGISSFLECHETPFSSKLSSDEYITRIFTLASGLEKACKVIKDNDSEKAFNKKLSEWCLHHERRVYDIGFFENACDHFLRKVLQSDLSYEMKMEAKYQYITIVSSTERSTSFIEMITKESSILTDVMKISVILNNCAQPKDKNSLYLLQHLSLIVHQCKLGKLKDTIKVMLTHLDIIVLDTILRALTFRVGNKSQESRQLKQTIMTTIMDLICNDQSLRCEFWKLSCWTDQIILLDVALMYSEFLDDMINFITASAEAMKVTMNQDKEMVWTNSEHYLSFTELNVLVECLMSDKGTIHIVIKSTVLKHAKGQRIYNIWCELAKLF